MTSLFVFTNPRETGPFARSLQVTWAQLITKTFQFLSLCIFHFSDFSYQQRYGAVETREAIMGTNGNKVSEPTIDDFMNQQAKKDNSIFY